MSMRLRSVVFDVPDEVYDATVAFWAAALGAGTRSITDNQAELVEPDSICGVVLNCREAATAASVHLQLEATDPQPDLRRVRAAGGQHLGTRPSDGAELVTSPAGLLVHIIGPGLRSPSLAAPGTNSARLHAVFIDVAASQLAPSVAFWTSVFETTATVSSYRSEYTRLDDVAGPGGRVDFEVQRVDDRPRIHVDLATEDVATESARLEALGAVQVARVDSWVILRDPAGLLLCVVPLHVEEQA